MTEGSLATETPRAGRPVRSWPIRIGRLLLALGLGYAAVCAGLYFMQDRLVFPAARFSADLPRRASNLEAITLPRDDGVVLRGILRKPTQPGDSRDSRNPRRPTIFYLGGNAEEVTWWATYAGWPADWNVVLVNYRGYGASSGSPSEPALYADTLALYDWARARADVDDQRLIVFGRSLGAAVATYLAGARPIRAVILTAPFDRLTEVARGIYPWLPVDLLLRHRFDSIDRVGALRQPLLMLVTPADRVVPPRHSQRLFAAWGGADKTTVTIPATDHSEIASDAAYWNAVRAFIERVK